jgi:hypothetical protein
MSGKASYSLRTNTLCLLFLYKTHVLLFKSEEPVQLLSVFPIIDRLAIGEKVCFCGENPCFCFGKDKFSVKHY